LSGVGINDPFTDNIIPLIQQAVDQLKAEIGNGKGIGVGVEKGDRQPSLPLLSDCPCFRGKNV